MEEIVNVIVQLFEFLNSIEIFGISLLWWAVAPALIGLAISLIAKKGKDDDEK